MTRHRRGPGAVLVALALAGVLVGCGSGAAAESSVGPSVSTETAAPPTGSATAAASATAASPTVAAPGASAGSASASPGTTPTGTLTVLAAASLKNTFTELGEAFQQQHPGATVTFSFAGSSDLAAQLIAGAPADVFASADTANMTKTTDAGLIAGPVNFATNTLTIVTPPGNPAGITSFADLAGDGVAVVVCAPQVPCGSATTRIEDATGVTLAPVSEESSVTDVLNKVQTGEADAGLVYVTDAAAAGDKVVVVEFPESAAAVNTYPIGALAGSAQPELAADFVALVTGPEGRQVLARAGFAPAP